jgi:hypothetical protein
VARSLTEVLDTAERGPDLDTERGNGPLPSIPKEEWRRLAGLDEEVKVGDVTTAEEEQEIVRRLEAQRVRERQQAERHRLRMAEQEREGIKRLQEALDDGRITIDPPLTSMQAHRKPVLVQETLPPRRRRLINAMPVLAIGGALAAVLWRLWPFL